MQVRRMQMRGLAEEGYVCANALRQSHYARVLSYLEKGVLIDASS